MHTTRFGRLALAPLVALLLLACSDTLNTSQDGPGATPTGPEAPSTATSSVTVLLTDDPADVVNAWVDIRQVYLQGGDAGGRQILFEGETGYIELLALADDAVSIIESIEIPSGTFGQLRIVLGAAAIELEGGEIFVTKGADPPEGLTTEDVTGELMCPSCSSSGFKVLLQGRDLSLIDPEELLVVDFSVDESFLKPAGNSGKWKLRPVIKLFDSLEEAG